MTRRRSRAQALLETAAVLPLFLVSLAALLFAVQAAVLMERGTVSLRYAGETLAYGSNMSDLGGAAIYLNLAEPTASSKLTTCAAPQLLTMTGASDITGHLSAALFQQSLSGFSASCNVANGAPINESIRFKSVDFTYGTVLLNRAYVSTSTPLDGFGAHTVGFSQTFFRGPGLRDILRCYPQLRHALQATLGSAQNDVSTPTTLQAPLYVDTNPQTWMQPNSSLTLNGETLDLDQNWCPSTN